MAVEQHTRPPLRQRRHTGESSAPADKNTEKWSEFLDEPEDAEYVEKTESIRAHEKTGRPLGADSFISHLEEITGILLRKLKPGPKPKRWEELDIYENN